MLYNLNLASMLLGCLLKQPNLIALPQYPLCKEDFEPVKFHKTMFICIHKLYRAGAQEITEVEIENLARNYPAQMEVLEDNNYMDFIYTTKEICILDNYEHYYNALRKFSLLRDLQASGVDIKEFFDELEDEDKEQSKLESLTIQKILNQVEARHSELRNKYDVKYVRDELIVGEDIDSLLDEFEDQPSFGALLSSPYLSKLIHGFSKGQLIMRSAPSGANKTRMAVADMCGLCVSQYYDLEKQEFVDNLNYQGQGILIHSELDSRREIQPMFLACVSGVPSNTITMGRCTKEEKKRVEKAAQILFEDQFKVISMPDYTSASLDRKIKESVENYGTSYVCFDYMALNGPLSMEYRKNTGVQAREDMALRGLATDLKDYAERYNIGILTMSQTNGNEKSIDFADESCIAGSKAMRNKVDAGFVMLPIKERPKDKKLIEPFLKFRGRCKPEEIPNRITYLYKARFGEYSDQKIKIYHHFDAAIMRNRDLFCCDINTNKIKIPLPVIEGE